MAQINVYFTFPGTCEAALNFYKDCLGGEFLSLERFGASPMEVAEDYKDKVMHATLQTRDTLIMGSDGMPGQNPTIGTNISLSINLTDEADQTEIFNKLSDGGSVIMPLQDTFWGARFGMLKDKFDINWMLNYDKPKTEA